MLLSTVAWHKAYMIGCSPAPWFSPALIDALLDFGRGHVLEVKPTQSR